MDTSRAVIPEVMGGTEGDLRLGEVMEVTSLYKYHKIFYMECSSVWI